MNERGLNHAAAIVQIIEMRQNYNGNRSMNNCESVVEEENIEEDENVSNER